MTSNFCVKIPTDAGSLGVFVLVRARLVAAATKNQKVFLVGMKTLYMLALKARLSANPKKTWGTRSAERGPMCINPGLGLTGEFPFSPVEMKPIGEGYSDARLKKK